MLENYPATAPEAQVREQTAQHITFYSISGPSNQTELNFMSPTECNSTKQYPFVIQ